MKLHLKQNDGKIVSYNGIYTSQASVIFSAIVTLNQNKTKKNQNKSTYKPTNPL